MLLFFRWLLHAVIRLLMVLMFFFVALRYVRVAAVHVSCLPLLYMFLRLCLAVGVALCC
jgi:hypothetical protein